MKLGNFVLTPLLRKLKDGMWPLTVEGPFKDGFQSVRYKERQCMLHKILFTSTNCIFASVAISLNDKERSFGGLLKAI